MRSALITVGCVTLLALGCRTSNRLPEGTTPQARIARARAALEEKRYERARVILAPVAALDPPAIESAEAAFLRAESYRLEGEARAALAAYRDYVERFPVSDFLAETEIRIFELAIEFLDGRHPTWLGLFRNRDRGVDALEFLLENYPRGRLTLEAQRRLAEYHFDRERWLDAIAEYGELIQRFPRSEWHSIAQYRIAVATVRQSRGAAYDPRILERARVEFRRYVEAFPEAPQVAEARAWLDIIDGLLAEKTYSIGAFYARDGAPYAARLFFDEVIERYPESEAAAKARRRLASMPPRPGSAATPSPEAAEDGDTASDHTASNDAASDDAAPGDEGEDSSLETPDGSGAAAGGVRP